MTRNSINLSNEEYQRYARHIIMPNINIQGQQRLKNAKVLFIGAGGLAAGALLYLAGAGIGHLGIVDDDSVEISNLHRQIIYRKTDIKKYKALSAKIQIKQLNPNCKISIYIEQLDKTNAKKIIKDYDIIIDSTDNFTVRYLLSNTCYQLHKIHIYGAVSSLEGQVSVFNYQGGPNYKDIYPYIERKNINRCNNEGVLGVITGLISLIQATETIKILTGIGTILNEEMLIYNSLDLSFKRIKLQNINITHTNSDDKSKINNLYSKNSKYLTWGDFKKFQKKHQEIIYIIDIRNPIEYHIQHIKNAINIPLHKLENHTNLKLLQAISINQFIIIYCSSANRSYLASWILNQANIRHWILQTSPIK